MESLSKHPVCGSHNPRGGTDLLYKIYRYVQTIQGRQRRGQSSGSVWSGNWSSTGRILTSAAVYEGLLWNRACKGQTIHAGVSQAFSHARGHFTSLARFARWTKKKGRLLVNHEARRSLTKKPKDYKLFYQVERECWTLDVVLISFFSFGLAKVYFSLKQCRADDGVFKAWSNF